MLVRCRGLPGNQELHEKIIVAYSPLEGAEPTLLDLFWNTSHEWVVAPPRRANVVLLLDANGRVGQDYRCSESHETANDWVSVGPDGSEVTSPNGKRLVLICEQGGLVLPNTWPGAAPTFYTPRSPEDHRVEFVALGAERHRSTTVVTDQVGGKSLQRTTTMDHFPVLVYAPPCKRWTFGSRGPPSLRWNKQAIRWALADETIQRSFLRTVDEAFSARVDLFVLPPTLSLHHCMRMWLQ